jgi:transposase
MKVRKFIKDDQWKKLEPLLAGKVGDVGATGKDNRLFLEAVLWIVRTGSPWRDLPSELGNWHTTYTRFIRWGKSGRWQQILTALSGDRDLEMLMLDSTVVRVHQHAAGAQKKRGRKRLAVRAAG